MEGRERAAGAGQTDGCSSASVVGCDENQRVTVKDICNVDDGDRSADEENENNNQQNADAIWKFVPSPPVPLRDQIEKDKEDESLRRWKEQLLGCVESDLDGETEPEVIFHSIGIISDDTGEISTPIPVDESKRGCALFTLKEGSEYQLKLAFTVLHNIVSGLTYTNTVWKGGLQVDQSKGMLGAFAPRREPYVHTLDQETAPSGVLARGMYSALLKHKDDNDAWLVFVNDQPRLDLDTARTVENLTKFVRFVARMSSNPSWICSMLHDKFRFWTSHQGVGPRKPLIEEYEKMAP